jgi:hypothetical protein
MINYLLCRATPTTVYRFLGSDLAEGREDRFVEELNENPPERIVLLSRDLREYGVSKYDEKSGEGRAILNGSRTIMSSPQEQAAIRWIPARWA